MNYYNQIIENRIFLAAVVGWLMAQIIKTLLYLSINKEFVAERLVGGGGMPSSHSSTVCALATAVALKYGVMGFEFAISVIFALVVMYDAIGVRQETGKQAKILNEMMEMMSRINDTMPVDERLKELIGHTPLQVFFGALLGIGVGIFYSI